MYSKIASSVLILVIYVVAFLGAFFVFRQLSFSENMVNVLISDIAATLIVFVFSVILKNSSVYDPYWSVAPPVIVVYLITISPEGNALRQWVIFALVLFWSVRLTVNWLRGWDGLKHQDWRYSDIANKTGMFYWPVSFLGIHLMPTIFVFLGCLPLWYSLNSPEPFNLIDVMAVLFTLSAVLTEWLADEQLKKFRKNNSNECFMKTGLWGISRHPNYLGEIGFWGGMFLFLFSASNLRNTNGYWTSIGFISMIILFLFISIPMMEKRNKTKRTGYHEYMKNVPALFPRIFKKSG